MRVSIIFDSIGIMLAKKCSSELFENTTGNLEISTFFFTMSAGTWSAGGPRLPARKLEEILNSIQFRNYIKISRVKITRQGLDKLINHWDLLLFFLLVGRPSFCAPYKAACKKIKKLLSETMTLDPGENHHLSGCFVASGPCYWHCMAPTFLWMICAQLWVTTLHLFRSQRAVWKVWKGPPISLFHCCDRVDDKLLCYLLAAFLLAISPLLFLLWIFFIDIFFILFFFHV